jgi:hypothetical protein
VEFVLSNERLANIKNRVGYFEGRRARATERLASTEGKSWYFAVLGLICSEHELALAPLAKLQRVVEPPGEIELAGALENKLILSAIARYSHHIEYELAVSREDDKDDQSAFNLAWWIVSALRVRTLSEILVPVVSDYSWSTIAALTNGGCHAQLLEDVPQARRLTEPVEVQPSDLEWISVNLVRFADLLEQPKFRLAVECLTTHHFSNSERMMAATLSAGIEALFDIQSELRFRLAVVVASVLEPRGRARRDLYRVVKKLYDTRSKAVHGGSLEETKIKEHVQEVRKLLSRLLSHIVERGSVPTEEEIEDLIFS